MQDIKNKLHFQVLTEDCYFVDPKEVELWNKAMDMLIDYSKSIGIEEDKLIARLHREDPAFKEWVNSRSDRRDPEKSKWVLVKANVCQSFLRLRNTKPEFAKMAWELFCNEYDFTDFYGEYFKDFDSSFTREEHKVFFKYMLTHYPNTGFCSWTQGEDLDDFEKEVSSSVLND